MPKYRIEMLLQLDDGRIVLRAIIVRSATALTIACRAIAAMAARDGHSLPQITDISTIH